MSLEKGGIKNNQANIEKEGKTNIFEKRGKAAKSIWSNFLNNLKTSTILGGALGLSSIASGQENPNKKADDVFLNNKTPKTEISINFPGGTKTFNSQEELEAFIKKTGLVKSGSVGGSVSNEDNQRKNVENLGRRRYRYTAPNGKDVRYFDSMKEVEKLAKILGDDDYQKRVEDSGQNLNKKDISLEKKPVAGFRLYTRNHINPDGRPVLSEKFRSMTELENFARSKNTPVDLRLISIIYTDNDEIDASKSRLTLEDLRNIRVEGNVNQPQSMPRGPQNPNIPITGQRIDKSNTVDYRDFIDQLPEGKGKIIKENPDGTKEIIKIKKRRTRN